MQATATNAVERELYIEAAPAIVYSYFTEPAKIVQWMAHDARLDVRPGGTLWLDYNGFDRARGEFIELVPHSRIVFSWGWETLGEQTPPGSSRVEVTLTPEGAGTRLRLVHSGLSAHEVEGHAQGWDLFLPFLAEAAKSGTAAQPPAEALSPSAAYASRLNGLLCDLRYLVEGMDAAAWSRKCPASGWTAAATAAHAVSHAALAHFAAAVTRGERAPQADFTLDSLNAFNAENATRNASVTREQVLAALLKEGPVAVEMLKGIDPAALGRSQPMAFAGGAEIPAAAILEGPLLGDLASHIADLRAALG